VRIASAAVIDVVASDGGVHEELLTVLGPSS
jgi:hypothetical protein